jgi:aarF domain-containing kinase
MLVRRNPARPSQTQVVLLDHGLYRQLEDHFRRDYCRLWQGIALGDAVQIERYCKRMQAGDLYTLLAAMITQRPWDDIVSDDIGRCVRVWRDNFLPSGRTVAIPLQGQ